ncbi:MAG: LytR/AlgR family response regulator transcription factor [Saprospiraceae bacterium]
MSIRAVIIEDETNGLRNLLAQIDDNCKEIEVIATGISNADLTRLISEHDKNPFEVAFLDIKVTDGLIFKSLQAAESTPFDIIFVTTYQEYALRSYEFAAIDYILKPVDPEDLKRAVSRIRRNNPQTKSRLNTLRKIQKQQLTLEDSIPIAGGSQVRYVKIKNIVRLEGIDNYTRIIMANGEKHTASQTLKTYDLLLTPLNFVRVHKKHLVNKEHITAYDRGNKIRTLTLQNGEKVEVARRRISVLL